MTPKKTKHNQWASQVSDLFAFILICELCGQRPATEFAHRLKRDLIGWRRDGEDGRSNEDKLEYFCGVRACRTCHTAMDEGKGKKVHENMYKRVTNAMLHRLAYLGATGFLLEVTEYALAYDWDPIRIYGQTEKQLTGVSRINRGLKEMTKTFCDDCAQEIVGRPEKEHNYRDSVTAKTEQLTIKIAISPVNKNSAICVDCAEAAFRHWIWATAAEKKK